MMIIVRRELECSESGHLLYCGRPFSGVVVDIEGGILVGKKFCSQGEVVGEYAPPFPQYKTSVLEIDIEFLEGDEAPFCFRGELYNGLAYSLYDGQYSIVQQYENGEEVSIAKYLDGSLISLWHADVDDSLTQDYVWDDFGNIKDFSLYAMSEFQVALHFESANKISLLTIRGNYFDQIKTIKNLVLVHQFDEPRFLRGISAGKKLLMSGQSITDGMFEDLLLDNGLQNTQCLQIYNTSVTNNSFKKIVGLSGISELYVESSVLNEGDLQAFKFEHSSCYVRFNGNEVSA